MFYQQRLNPIAQFALLLSFCGVGIIISSVVTGLIGNMIMHVPVTQIANELLKPQYIQVYRLLQVITSFLVMALPALIVGFINGGKPIANLGFSETLSGKQVFLVIIMVFVGFLLSGALGELNHMIPVSKTAATYFNKLEEDYNKQVIAISNMKSTTDYILSLMVLAIVPAIFEEMLFRGGLQQIMVSLTRNAFAGILITSILFSAIHFSFYGFLPRLFLGLMLGYIFYYSKNLWLNILAHFLNNAYTLTILYAMSRAGKLNTDAMEDTFPLYYGLIGAAAILMLFVIFKRESRRLLPEIENNGHSNYHS